MIPQISFSDFPKICRLCMKEGDFVSILDRPDLISVYVSITNISVSFTYNSPLMKLFHKNIFRSMILTLFQKIYARNV